MIRDPAVFIRANTHLAPAAFVPEIRIHQASEALPLWEATEAELERTGLAPPFWAFAWAGGQALARHILDNPSLVAGRRVLDLAAGCGLVGIAASRAGAAHIDFNDIDPFCAAAIELNWSGNGLNGSHAMLIEDLLRDGPKVPAGHAPWDVVLAGDICYERDMAERMFTWLSARAHTGALVLIGDPGRNYAPKDGVEKVAEFEVPTDQDLEDGPSRHTAVLRITGD